MSIASITCRSLLASLHYCSDDDDGRGTHRPRGRGEGGGGGGGGLRCVARGGSYNMSHCVALGQR